MAKDGTFKYGGRDNAPDPLIIPGRTVGDLLQLVRLARQLWRRARNSPGPRRILPYDPKIIKHADQLDHRRRQPVDHDRAEPDAGRIQGGGAFLKYIGQPNVDATWAAEHRLCPGDACRYEAVASSRAFSTRTSAPTAGQQLARGHRDAQHARPAARPAAGNPQHHLTRNSRRPCKAADRPAGDGRRDRARQQRAQAVRKLGEGIRVTGSAWRSLISNGTPHPV